MARTWRQNTSYGQIMKDSRDDSAKETEESSGNGGNTRLPFGLCKRYGISLPDNARPRDAWNALKGVGITPEKVYKDVEPDGKVDFKPNDKYHDDNSKESFIKWAEKNGVNISTNFFDILPDNEATLSQLNRYKSLASEFPIKSFSSLTLVAKSLSAKETMALTRYSPSDKKVSIEFNSTAFKDEKNLIETVRTMTEIGWWSKTSEDSLKYQTITHEYGHLIVNEILSKNGYSERSQEILERLKGEAAFDYKKRKTLQKDYLREAENLRNEIFYSKFLPEIFNKAKQYDSQIQVPLKFTKTGYKSAPHISDYGATSWSEYIAESFANGMCGASTAIGKATVEVLKEAIRS